jgi:hypothetical protein
VTLDEKRERQLAKLRQRHADDPAYRERHRGHQIKTAYGLLPEQYEALVDRQDGLCAICRKPPGKRALHIDHNHETEDPEGLFGGEIVPAYSQIIEGLPWDMLAADDLLYIPWNPESARHACAPSVSTRDSEGVQSGDERVPHQPAG